MSIKVTDDCMGCEKCLDVCPVGAMVMNVYAIVDETVCMECGNCVDACPVEAIVYDNGRMVL